MSPRKQSGSKTTERSTAETFEAALKRLEEIVEKLEEGTVPLEEAIGMYEEGVTISKNCLERLRQAELRLKVLTEDAEGNIELADEERDDEDESDG
jgi:exodeoxyribonuclease VII small subunit